MNFFDGLKVLLLGMFVRTVFGGHSGSFAPSLGRSSFWDQKYFSASMTIFWIERSYGVGSSVFEDLWVEFDAWYIV